MIVLMFVRSFFRSFVCFFFARSSRRIWICMNNNFNVRTLTEQEHVCIRLTSIKLFIDIFHNSNSIHFNSLVCCCTLLLLLLLLLETKCVHTRSTNKWISISFDSNRNKNRQHQDSHICPSTEHQTVLIYYFQNKRKQKKYIIYYYECHNGNGMLHGSSCNRINKRLLYARRYEK